jgi:hypothetical protein
VRLRVLISTLVILTVVSTAWAQPPKVTVFPDSLNLWMEFQGTAVGSFRITHRSSDMLKYRITWDPALDTAWYWSSLDDYAPVTADSLLRASIFRPRRDFVLFEFKFPLLIQGRTRLEFSLFESSSLTGSYRRVFARSRREDSLTFNDYASSGPMALRLYGARYYAFGIAWDRPVQYRFPGSMWMTADGLDLQFIGNFNKTHTFRSDTALFISTIQSGAGYDLVITGGAFPLWLELLTDSIGTVAGGDTNVVSFRARDPGNVTYFTPLTGYLTVHSDNPVDSLKHVTVSRQLVTGVYRPQYDSPALYELGQNYPNPFNPTTKIQFTIVNRRLTTVKVYDVLGREVSTLVNEVKEPGTYSVEFDGTNLASGVYFYRLQAGDFVATKKLVLLK